MGSPSYLLRERSHACMVQTKKPRISALSTADSVKKLPAPAAGVRMDGIVTGHGPIAWHAGVGLRGGMKRVLRQVHRLGSALRYRAVTSFNGAATGLPSSAGTKEGLSRQRVNKAPAAASGTMASQKCYSASGIAGNFEFGAMEDARPPCSHHSPKPIEQCRYKSKGDQ
jgi:hypothetical protein